MNDNQDMYNKICALSEEICKNTRQSPNYMQFSDTPMNRILVEKITGKTYEQCVADKTIVTLMSKDMNKDLEDELAEIAGPDPYGGN